MLQIIAGERQRKDKTITGQGKMEIKKLPMAASYTWTRMRNTCMS